MLSTSKDVETCLRSETATSLTLRLTVKTFATQGFHTYDGCSDCGKKVKHGRKCEYCKSETFTLRRCYRLVLNLSDNTTDVWAFAWESGHHIMGMSATNFRKLESSNEELHAL